jgi:hypothetical protein
MRPFARWLAPRTERTKRVSDPERLAVAASAVLLDAQRTQLDAEDAVAQAETSVNVSVVAIYKALGGVGQPLSDDPATRQARIP